MCVRWRERGWLQLHLAAASGAGRSEWDSPNTPMPASFRAAQGSSSDFPLPPPPQHLCSAPCAPGRLSAAPKVTAPFPVLLPPLSGQERTCARGSARTEGPARYVVCVSVGRLGWTCPQDRGGGWLSPQKTSLVCPRQALQSPHAFSAPGPGEGSRPVPFKGHQPMDSISIDAPVAETIATSVSVGEAPLPDYLGALEML